MTVFSERLTIAYPGTQLIVRMTSRSIIALYVIVDSSTRRRESVAELVCRRADRQAGGRQNPLDGSLLVGSATVLGDFFLGVSHAREGVAVQLLLLRTTCCWPQWFRGVRGRGRKGYQTIVDQRRFSFSLRCDCCSSRIQTTQFFLSGFFLRRPSHNVLTVNFAAKNRSAGTLTGIRSVDSSDRNSSGLCVGAQ